MVRRKAASRLLAGTLLAAMIPLPFGGTVQAAESGGSFADVVPGVWYAGAVSYVYDNGLMSGISSSMFAPELSMSRAMLATVLYRMAGSPAVSGRDNFTDTENDAWYSEAVLWAQQNGYVTGYSSQTFGTNDPVTREQVATILWRYAGSFVALCRQPGRQRRYTLCRWGRDLVLGGSRSGLGPGGAGDQR